jgi:two-component system sensor histidine kinase TctE
MSQHRPSLRTRLAQHVLVPLVITWAAGTAVTLAMASYFAGQAFDRALLDDAYALAAHVTQGPVGQPGLNLSIDDMSTLLFDQSESIFFAVYGEEGQFVGGHAGLRPPVLPANVTSQFTNIFFQGREMRSVTLRRTEPVQVEIVMAQTSATRTRLLQRLLVYSAIPQAVLLVFLAWWLRRSIGRDLGPLAALQQALGRRDASDLRPMPDDVTTSASSRDVDNLRLALNSLLLRLGRSIEAQREFAGNVAHELRTPLAGIRAQVSYALAQQSPAVWHEQLRGIAEGEQRASHLVEQLLALARADEGRAALQLQPLPLDELVRDVVLRFMHKADAVGVDLGAEGLEQPTTVVGDVALVEGILGNLLDNALRYAVGSDAHVTVSVLLEGGQTVLRVVDNGPGMSAQDMLFWGQRWALGEAGQRLGEGFGLGLSIVRRYAELLGAEFSLTPGMDGRGICASLRFGPPPA